MELNLLSALSHGPSTHGEYASLWRRAPNHLHPHSPTAPPEVSAQGPFYLHLHPGSLRCPRWAHQRATNRANSVKSLGLLEKDSVYKEALGETQG